jgi:hypothetical protein
MGDFFMYGAQFGRGLMAWGIVLGPGMRVSNLAYHLSPSLGAEPATSKSCCVLAKQLRLVRVGVNAGERTQPKR